MDKLSKSFSLTIEGATLNEASIAASETLVDLSENVIDTVTDIADDIPIIKTILTIPKVFRGISNLMLAKKIIKFLTQLESISQEERKKFMNELEEGKRNQIIENLMLVIEKHDHYKKSEIQGKIFKAYIKGGVNENEYNSLTYATSSINTYNLEKLINYYKKVSPGRTDPGMKTEELYYFSFLQLLSIDNSRLGTYDSGEPAFNKNALGSKYIQILLS